MLFIQLHMQQKIQYTLFSSLFESQKKQVITKSGHLNKCEVSEVANQTAVWQVWLLQAPVF